MRNHADTAEDQPPLLTLAEVGIELRLGRTSISRLVGTGELPSVRLGRRRFVRRSDLTAFVESLNP